MTLPTIGLPEVSLSATVIVAYELPSSLTRRELVVTIEFCSLNGLCVKFTEADWVTWM